MQLLLLLPIYLIRILKNTRKKLNKVSETLPPESEYNEI
jgi:hypothetical protein